MSLINQLITIKPIKNVLNDNERWASSILQ